MTDCLMKNCLFRDTIQCPCIEKFNQLPEIRTSNVTVVLSPPSATILINTEKDWVKDDTGMARAFEVQADADYRDCKTCAKNEKCEDAWLEFHNSACWIEE